MMAKQNLYQVHVSMKHIVYVAAKDISEAERFAKKEGVDLGEGQDVESEAWPLNGGPDCVAEGEHDQLILGLPGKWDMTVCEWLTQADKDAEARAEEMQGSLPIQLPPVKGQDNE